MGVNYWMHAFGVRSIWGALYHKFGRCQILNKINRGYLPRKGIKGILKHEGTNSEDRRQKAEDRRQKTGDRSQNVGGRPGAWLSVFIEHFRGEALEAVVDLVAGMAHLY